MGTNKLGAAKFVTHHFVLSDIATAYETFAHAADTGALKVMLHNDESI